MQTLIQALSIFLIFFISWRIWKAETTAKMRKFFWPALAAKLSAGILVGVLYAIFYTTSDTFYFFDSAVQLSQQARSDFAGYLNFLFSQSDAYFAGEDRTIFFIKITSIFTLITFDNYWICSLYFSFFSFLAAWKLTKFIWLNIQDLGIAAAAAFLFFPSCVFWASGILKESVAMTALFYLTNVFLQLWLRKKTSLIHIAWVALAIWVIWNLKYYYIGLFVPVIATTLLTRRIIESIQVKGFVRECTVWILLFSVLMVGVSFIHPNFSLQRIADVLIQNHNAIIQVSNSDDVIHFYNLSATWSSIATNTPWAFISGMFRPFIWEANTFLKTVVSIENLILLMASILSIRWWAKIRSSSYRLPILAVLVYCFVLCVFLAISTPNFGTLTRFRIGFLPFLILLLASQPVIIRPLSRLFNVPLTDLVR
jgi:hypothetical protein